jgi:hypothetical protein
MFGHGVHLNYLAIAETTILHHLLFQAEQNPLSRSQVLTGLAAAESSRQSRPDPCDEGNTQVFSAILMGQSRIVIGIIGRASG